MPTTCDGRRWSNGKPKPVTLVAIVVRRKTAVQPSRRCPPSMPAATTSPDPIATRLIATWTSVYVAVDMPKIIVWSLRAASADEQEARGLEREEVAPRDRARTRRRVAQIREGVAGLPAVQLLDPTVLGGHLAEALLRAALELRAATSEASGA